MRSAGDVLLLSTYELGHQPVGLAMPLGFLERAGYRPVARDLAIDELDEEEVRRARFVGISVPMHTALRSGIEVARRIRALNPRAHVCFYGLYAPLNAQLLLGTAATGNAVAGRDEGRLADSLVGGEFEVALVEQVAAVERGLGFERASSPALARLPFALPSRAALPPLTRYARIIHSDGTTGLAGYVEASRGCLHTCRHCPIPAVYDGRFFVVPQPIVVDDVRRLVAAGATHVTFGDPDFLNGPGHALSIARAVHAEFPSLTFDVTTKIEHILRHTEVFPELARLGCLFVVSAVESLNDHVLRVLDKGHTRADVITALAVLRAAGITLRPSLVPFTPWETLDSYLDLFDFLEEHRLDGAIDPVHLTIRLLVPPGSLLLGHPELRPHLGALDEERLSYRWTHPDPRMDALQPALARIAARAARLTDPTPSSVSETLAELRAQALRAAGRAPSLPPPIRLATPAAPRLSEAWFC